MSRRWEGEEGRKDGGGGGSSRCKGPRWEEAPCGRETEAGPHALPTEAGVLHKVLVNIRENECEGAEGPVKQHT